MPDLSLKSETFFFLKKKRVSKHRNGRAVEIAEAAGIHREERSQRGNKETRLLSILLTEEQIQSPVVFSGTCSHKCRSGSLKLTLSKAPSSILGIPAAV